jgi:hypothetical protein
MITRDYEYDPDCYPSPEPFHCGSPALVADARLGGQPATAIADARGIRVSTEDSEFEISRPLIRRDAARIMELLPGDISPSQLLRLGFRRLA